MNWHGIDPEMRVLTQLLLLLSFESTAGKLSDANTSTVFIISENCVAP
jgi:hypothetical protein